VNSQSGLHSNLSLAASTPLASRSVSEVIELEQREKIAMGPLDRLAQCHCCRDGQYVLCRGSRRVVRLLGGREQSVAQPELRSVPFRFINDDCVA
jgi:hypothetical protein